MAVSGEAYTVDDFIHGSPESLIQADQDPRMLVTWMHGDETLGPRVGHELYTNRPELLANVDYLCGNPLAAGEDPAIRYTVGGTDLNRSYTPGIAPTSYEQQRASDIADFISTEGYRYVLDMHTTTTEVGRCIIVDKEFFESGAARDIVAASPIEKVVLFPKWISQDGLIGHFPNSVSIEYNRAEADRVGVEETMLTIAGLIRGQSLAGPRERQLFEVTGLIPKSEDPGSQARNFELCEQGYYPVLFGENSYRTDPTKKYLGFAATGLTTVTL